MPINYPRKGGKANSRGESQAKASQARENSAVHELEHEAPRAGRKKTGEHVLARVERPVRVKGA